MKQSKFIGLVLAVSLLTIPAAARADSLLQKIATVVLADKFGIDTRSVDTFRQQTKLPVYDIAPYYEGAHYFNRSPSTVWQLRQQGLGWGQIAQRLGMNPGTFNKLRNQGAFDRDRFWANNYQERFQVPSDRVAVLRRSGGSLEDVLGAIVIGKLTKKDPRDVYNQYKTQRSWTTIANTNNVRMEDWQRVTRPVQSRFTIHTDNGVRDHGAGIGKGKSQGKNGQSHGKVGGKGKGKGGG